MTKLMKQIITAVALVLVIAIMGGLYFLLTREEPEVIEENKLGAFGETMKNGRPFIVDQVQNADLDSILVHNEYDEYSLIHKDSGAYKIEGLEGYEVNQEMFSYLRTNATYLLAVSYVENAELDKLEQYGIDRENPRIWFEVKYNDNKDSYKILVGDKTPDGIGYYAMLEGRDALYIVDTGLEKAILQPRKAYVVPTLVNSVDSNSVYLIKRFDMNKKGERFISIEKSGELTYGNNSTHRVTYPAYNYATNLTNFEALVTSLASLSGVQTLYYGDEITPELLQALGFFDAEGNDISDYSFSYSYPAFSEYLYIMKDAESGNFIVYSLKGNLIATVSAEALAFLDGEMLLWISSEIYMLDIEDIATVEFERDGEKAVFVLSGSGSEMTVSGNGVPVDTLKFKEMYKSLMYIVVTAWAEYDMCPKEQLKLTITLESGEVLDYLFYAYSATNSYYTLNGFGQFFVSAEKVRALGDTAFTLVK